MQSIIYSSSFQVKVKGKYTSSFIEDICEKLSENPKLGKKFQAVNNIYKYDLDMSMDNKNQYSLIYYFQDKNAPIPLLNIFKKNERDLLSKVITTLTQENAF